MTRRINFKFRPGQHLELDVRPMWAVGRKRQVERIRGLVVQVAKARDGVETIRVVVEGVEGERAIDVDDVRSVRDMALEREWERLRELDRSGELESLSDKANEDT